MTFGTPDALRQAETASGASPGTRKTSMAFQTRSNGSLHASAMTPSDGAPKARGTYPRKEVMTTVAQRIRFP